LPACQRDAQDPPLSLVHRAEAGEHSRLGVEKALHVAELDEGLIGRAASARASAARARSATAIPESSPDADRGTEVRAGDVWGRGPGQTASASPGAGVGDTCGVSVGIG
jgi:hypothetical protein